MRLLLFLALAHTVSSAVVSTYTVTTTPGSSPVPHPGGVITVLARQGDHYSAYGSGLTSTLSDASKFSLTTVPGSTAFDTQGDLGGTYAMIVDFLPSQDYTNDEIASLQAFLNTGGRLLVSGENTGCCSVHNGRINALTSALGAPVSIIGDGSGTLIPNGVSTVSGVTTVPQGSWSRLEIDDSVAAVLAASDQGHIWGADLYIGQGRLTVIADVQVLTGGADSDRMMQNFVNEAASFQSVVAGGGNPNPSAGPTAPPDAPPAGPPSLPPPGAPPAGPPPPPPTHEVCGCIVLLDGLSTQSELCVRRTTGVCKPVYGGCPSDMDLCTSSTPPCEDDPGRWRMRKCPKKSHKCHKKKMKRKCRKTCNNC
jgi:hypothetical protein